MTPHTPRLRSSVPLTVADNGLAAASAASLLDWLPGTPTPKDLDPMADASLPPAPGVPWLIYLIKQVELAAKQHFDAILEPHGVTVNQFTALTVLARTPGMTSARLARNSFVRVQSMAQTMAALEARGLINREIDPESRRQLRTSITPEGHALMRAVAGPLEQLEQEMLQGLSSEQIATLADALRRARLSLSGSHAH